MKPNIKKYPLIVFRILFQLYYTYLEFAKSREEIHLGYQIVNKIENILDEKLFRKFVQLHNKNTEIKTIEQTILSLHQEAYSQSTSQIEALEKQLLDVKNKFKNLSNLQPKSLKNIVKKFLKKHPELIPAEVENKLSTDLQYFLKEKSKSVVWYKKQRIKNDELPKFTKELLNTNANLIIKIVETADNTDAFLRALLFAATLLDDIEAVAMLLSQEKIDVNMKEFAWNMGLPLHCASFYGHEEIVKLLLNAGAKVGIANNAGDTALHLAAKGNYPKIVELLLNQQGIELEKKNTKQKTPLQLAFEEGNSNNEDVIFHLISAGANFKIIYSSNNTLLFLLAHSLLIKKDYSRVTELLLRMEKFDINSQQVESGYTLLHLAAYCNAAKTAKLLLDQKNINLQLTDREGKTAEQVAVSKQHIDVLSEFVAFKRWDFQKVLSVAEDKLTKEWQSAAAYLLVAQRLNNTNFISYIEEKLNSSNFLLSCGKPFIKTLDLYIVINKPEILITLAKFYEKGFLVNKALTSAISLYEDALDNLIKSTIKLYKKKDIEQDGFFERESNHVLLAIKNNDLQTASTIKWLVNCLLEQRKEEEEKEEKTLLKNYLTQWNLTLETSQANSQVKKVQQAIIDLCIYACANSTTISFWSSQYVSVIEKAGTTSHSKMSQVVDHLRILKKEIPFSSGEFALFSFILSQVRLEQLIITASELEKIMMPVQETTFLEEKTEYRNFER